jgi:predicted enzyme related to lactoylglutathione lyase
MAGSFTWLDLMSPDQAEAIDFYTRALGFTTEKWGGGDYTMLKSGDETFGGVMTLPAEAVATGSPPHWLGYVSVDDLGVSVGRAKALGGTVLRDTTPIPDVGAFAILQDPTGGVFALFRSNRPDGGQPLKSIAWTELMSTDPQRALAFYCALFGWNPTTSMELGDQGGTYQMFGTGDESIGGVMKSPMGTTTWAYYFAVDDCGKRMEAAAALGATPILGPMEVPGGRAVLMSDPSGAAFALFST